MHWRSTAGERWSEPPRLIALLEPPDAEAPGAPRSWRSVVAVAGASATGDAAAGAAAGGPPPLEEVRREALEEHQRPGERGDGERRCKLKRGHASHAVRILCAAGPGSRQAPTPAAVRSAPVPARAP